MKERTINFKIVFSFIVTLLLVGSMIALVIINRAKPLFTVSFLANDYLNQTFVHQVVTFGLSLVIILVMGLLTNFQSIKLLAINKIDAPVNPEPWIGITKNTKDTWKTLGRNVAIIITIITGVVIYFQVITKGIVEKPTFGNIMLVVFLALVNSFVEEVAYRHTFASVVEHNGLNRYISQGISALVFGIAHYWGSPGGIPGVLMAAYLGWFLSKSIHETKGFFWAWMIHFLQDIVIMIPLYLGNHLF